MGSSEKLMEKIHPSRILIIDGKRIYTLAGREVRETDFLYPETHYSKPGVLMEGVRSMPLQVFFGKFPPGEEFCNYVPPDKKNFAQEYDPEAISSLQQALYLSLISDSLACMTCTLHLAGKEAVEDIMEKTGANPDNLSPLGKRHYNVYSGYGDDLNRLLGFEVI